MDFAPADDMTDETPVDTPEADAELPGDPNSSDSADGLNREDVPERATLVEETVELAWVPEVEGSEMALPDAIEANASAIQEKADGYEVKNHDLAIEGIRDDLADLRTENEALRERVETLERWRKSTVNTVNRNISDINRLSAAIFGNEPLCPECGNGHLERNEGWNGKTIACTACEFNEKLE